MEEVVLETTARDARGTRAARRLRKQGILPLTLCGRGTPSAHLQAPSREVEKVVRGGARIVTLVHPDGRDRAFLKEIQYDHLGEGIYHLDFTRIAQDEALEMEVDLVLKGKPVGVLEEGGVLDQYVKTVKISCLPDSIPGRIEADVSGLKMNQHLTVKDLVAPAGVKLLQDAALVLAAVTEHKVEEVVPAVAEVGPLEPEVIKKERAAEEPEEAGKEPGKEPKKEKEAKKEKE